MSTPAPQPTPGRYLDTAGTLYEATRKGRPPGWYLQRLSGYQRTYDDAPFPYEQFPLAVQSAAFTLIKTI